MHTSWGTWILNNLIVAYRNNVAYCFFYRLERFIAVFFTSCTIISLKLGVPIYYVYIHIFIDILNLRDILVHYKKKCDTRKPAQSIWKKKIYIYICIYIYRIYTLYQAFPLLSKHLIFYANANVRLILLHKIRLINLQLNLA